LQGHETNYLGQEEAIAAQLSRQIHQVRTAMHHHPQNQKRAQKEILALISTGEHVAIKTLSLLLQTPLLVTQIETPCRALTSVLVVNGTIFLHVLLPRIHGIFGVLAP
jgi:hypothetical protein